MMWLNRLGIILNFLAGFLLAPELLGVERVKKAQAKLANISLKAQSLVNSGTLQLQHRYQMALGFTALVIIPSIISLLTSLTAYVLLKPSISQLVVVFVVNFMLSAYFIIFVMFLIFKGISSLVAGFFRSITKSQKKTKDEPTYIFFIETGTMTITVITYVIMLPFILVFLVILRAIEVVVNAIVKKFEHESTFRSTVIVLGIIFFIFGNALQLLSTF